MATWEALGAKTTGLGKGAPRRCPPPGDCSDQLLSEIGGIVTILRISATDRAACRQLEIAARALRPIDCSGICKNSGRSHNSEFLLIPLPGVVVLERARRLPMANAQMQTDQHRRFVERFLREQHRLYGYIVTLVPQRADAEEIFQETSLLLWEKWSDFDQSRDLLPWACGIAHNVLRNYLRKKKPMAVNLDESFLERVAEVRLEREASLEPRRVAEADRAVLQRVREVKPACHCRPRQCPLIVACAWKREKRDRAPPSLAAASFPEDRASPPTVSAVR